jgi:hypothetical protein
VSAKPKGTTPAADEAEPAAPKKPNKKDQILSLFSAGIHELPDLAHMTQSRPSYVASVLQDAGLMTGYFDLYTPSNQPMNVYSKFFAGKLGFRDVETAQKSLELIDRLYRQFDQIQDRAGQHHALVMALTMFDRARWTNKGPEAEVFRKWLLERLEEGEQRVAPVPATPAPDTKAMSKASTGAAPPAKRGKRASNAAKT